jgi:enoyl-CoA hydratase/carnithine racemase
VESEVLAVERRPDGIAVLTMNRPEKLNAMGPAFFRELPQVLDSLDADPAIAACVVTGAGRAFSAGGDIDSFAELKDVRAYRRHLRLVYDAFHSVERAGVPVIAAVNGIAFGGGTELTLACDLAIASERAVFSFKEATMGLMPGYGVIRGPEIIGRRATRLLALTGMEVNAVKARELGLIEEVVSHSELLDQAIQLATMIGSRAPLAVRLAKQFINRGQDSPGLPESIEATALLFTTEDHKEAVDSFINKRSPEFRGK